jgi:hypothetical protein
MDPEDIFGMPWVFVLKQYGFCEGCGDIPLNGLGGFWYCVQGQVFGSWKSSMPDVNIVASVVFGSSCFPSRVVTGVVCVVLHHEALFLVPDGACCGVSMLRLISRGTVLRRCIYLGLCMYRGVVPVCVCVYVCMCVPNGACMNMHAKKPREAAEHSLDGGGP